MPFQGTPIHRVNVSGMPPEQAIAKLEEMVNYLVETLLHSRLVLERREQSITPTAGELLFDGSSLRVALPTNDGTGVEYVVLASRWDKMLQKTFLWTR